MSVEALLKKLVRFKPYFGKEGGVTFSGGEPLLQASFLNELVPLLNDNGIRYVLDTSGQISLSEDVCSLFDGAQSVLLDLKFWDDDSYRKYTGGMLDKTMEVLRYLEKIGKKTVVRTVIIPEINDSLEAIDRYWELIKSFSCVSKYELLAFHTMGFFKYEKAGIPNPLSHLPPLPENKYSVLQAYADLKQKNG